MTRERWCMAGFAAVLCGLFAVWWMLSERLPPAYSSHAIGPGRFPELVAGLGLFFSLAMLACAVAGIGFRPTVTLEAPGATVGFLVLLPAYAVLMQLAGFYVASALALPLLMLLAGGRRVALLVAVPVLFCLFVYLCFGMALKVPIP